MDYEYFGNNPMDLSNNQVIAILERDNLRQGENGGVVNSVNIQFRGIKRNQNRNGKTYHSDDG